LRTVQIGHRDTAGCGFMLAHAINKLTKHRAINIRFVQNYMRYPCMVEAGNYTPAQMRKMLYKAEVVHFHIHVKPLFVTLRLDPKRFRNKKVLVYYHGTMLRNYTEELRAEVEEFIPDCITTVSTPDLLKYVKDSVWLPVCRSFTEISEKYGQNSKDLKALRSFGGKKAVVFGHPTTSVGKKGSKLFFGVLTKVIRGNVGVRGSMIINSSWDACLRKMSGFSVLLGEARLGVTQLTQVEAAVFKIPVVSLLTQETAGLYKKLVGEVPPVVTWKDESDLQEKLYMLAERPDVRHLLGQDIHDYLVKLHDEQPVVDRYLEILKGTV